MSWYGFLFIKYSVIMMLKGKKKKEQAKARSWHNIDILIQGLQVYTEMQRATVLYVNDFVKLGIPD